MIIEIFTSSQIVFDPLLVVTELSPPDQILVDGKVTGKGTEFIRAIVAKASLTPDIQRYPWARAFRLASTIQNTFIYTIAPTKGRENNFHWIGPVSHFELAFVALKERDDIIINNTEEAKKMRDWAYPMKVVFSPFGGRYGVNKGVLDSAGKSKCSRPWVPLYIGR
jgi:polar amino acid transport system substrate-binding protein